jgi:hypothetical protein
LLGSHGPLQVLVVTQELIAHELPLSIKPSTTRQINHM